jgi:hypothetical protein
MICIYHFVFQEFDLALTLSIEYLIVLNYLFSFVIFIPRLSRINSDRHLLTDIVKNWSVAENSETHQFG